MSDIDFSNIWVINNPEETRKAAPLLLRLMSIVLKDIYKACKPNKYTWSNYVSTSYWLLHKYINNLSYPEGKSF